MDPIPINLVPDGGLGTVHGANLGQIQTYTGFKSEVHYNLYITTEIHGYGIFDGKRLPATVLVYDLISTGGPEKRIKNLTLQITFKPVAPAEHPRIIHIQPEIPVDMTTTDEEQVLTRTDEIEGGGQVGYGPAKGYLKGKHTDQTQITKKKYFAATVHGSRRPSERRLRYPDTVHWVARENQSQSDGIMPECYFAALIIRPTGGDFVAHYKVTAEVDWAYSVKQAMSEFKDWISKDSPRQTFTPATNPSIDKPPEDLHKYTDVEELKKFVEIKTRYEYNQYKHGSDPTSAQQTQGTGQPAGPATNPQQAAAGGAAGGASGGNGGGGGDDGAAGAGNVDTEDPGQEEGAGEDAAQEDANISAPGNDSIDPGAA